MKDTISVYVSDWVHIDEEVDVSMDDVLRRITKEQFAELIKKHGAPQDATSIFDDVRKGMECEAMLGRPDEFGVRQCVAGVDIDVRDSARLLAEMWLEGYRHARGQQ